MTLKQIIQRLKTLAESHRQINTFFYGSFDEFLDREDILYPAIFCELNTDANISLENRLTNYTFTFYFFDLMDIANRSLKNYDDVMSDMSSLAQDYLAMIYDVQFQDWIVAEDYNLTIRDYELQDLTSGVSIEVTIGSKYDANLCQVPLNDIIDYTFENGTLKQVLKRIQTLANKHRQINTFFYGAFDEFLDGSDIIYPALFCELNESSTISFKDRLTNYSFTFYFFDLLDTANRSLVNGIEVKSDMSSIAQDFLAMLYDTTFRGWDIGLNYVMSINNYELQDLTCGVSVKVDISTKYDANLCQVPVGEVGNFILVNNTELLLIDNTNKLMYA